MDVCRPVARPPWTATLLFVYAADGGLGHALLDVAKKLVTTAGSSCRLCTLTHGPFAMRPQWRRFLAGLDVPVQFLHRDQFRSRFPEQAAALPAVFLVQHCTPRLLVAAGEIGATATLDGLQQLVRRRLHDERQRTLHARRAADLRNRA